MTGEPDFVVPRVRHDATITLSAPDPAWPSLYDGVAARIRGALGAQVLVLEHVGSTSVADLPAKPVIDVVLEVADTVDEDAYVPALAATGFELALREPDWFEHRLLRGVDPAVHLHVFPVGCVETRRMLAFRDRLRAHPAERERYAAAKVELAARTWEHAQDYADAKTDVVAAIVAAALAEPPA